MSLVTDFILGGGGAAPGSPEVLEDRGGARRCLVLPKRARQVQLETPASALKWPHELPLESRPKKGAQKMWNKEGSAFGTKEGRKELGLEGR